MTKQKTENQLFPISITDSLQIKDYSSLFKISQKIGKQGAGFVGTTKDCRAMKRRLNKLNRKLNNLRKAKAKPYRKSLKLFKHQIDVLRDNISVGIKAMDDQLDKLDQNRLAKLHDKYQPIWDRYNRTNGLPPSKLPKDIIAKKSMSKKQRLEKLGQEAKGAKATWDVQHARDINGQAVDVDKQTGEIKPLRNVHVKHFTAMGTNIQLVALKQFAKKNGIKLKEN